MFDMLRALSISRTPAFVRVSHADHAEIGRALDGGAHRGRRAADRLGGGGGAGGARVSLRAGRGTQHRADAGEALRPGRPARRGRVRAVPPDDRVAGGAGRRRGDRAVDGVDGLFVGPADLALDLGVTGDELDEVLRRIARTCRDRGKLAGAFGMGADRIPGWVQLGYKFLAVDSDATFLLQAARAALTGARRALPQASTRG